MTAALDTFLSRELARPVVPPIAAAGKVIAERLGGVAALFYGSVLRTGDLDGMLDFYILTDGARGTGLRGLASRRLWPDISFEEVTVDGRVLRAKVATMPLATFRQAAGGDLVDTTIWTRFVQPAALIWYANDATRGRVLDAVAAAARTAARYAAVLGPPMGTADTYWRSLFRATYRAELRVEKPGREDQILAVAPDRYAALLPLAWDAAGIGYTVRDGGLALHLAPADAQRIRRGWRRRQRRGKLLNAARLVKAAFLLDGAARYGAYKIERHTGIKVAIGPWRERHPILAAPGILWRVWRERRRTA